MITSRVALLLPAIGLFLFEVTPGLMEVAQDTPGLPTTGRIAMLYGRFAAVGIFVGVLIVFSAGQLVWRERDARQHDFTGTHPVSDAVMLAGRFSGLVLLLVTLQAVLIGAGSATQAALGHHDYDLALYVRVLLGLKLADYLLFAVLAMAIHVVVNQKYLSTTMAMLAWLSTGYSRELGIEHNLLKYAADPGVTYSEISGFGASLGPWLWFKLYWAGWAILFALLARLFWVRGDDTRRLALARRRFTRLPMAIAAVALALIGGAGGFVFYNTNVLNDYLSADEAAELSADYERRYGRYADLAQPLLAAQTLHVELHPAERRAEVRGTYRLENRSGRPIDAIHLLTPRTIPTTGITFDRPARATLIDRELGYRIYALATPLAPGGSLRLGFQLRIESRGFTNSGIGSAIAANGTFLENRPGSGGGMWLPSVGYRRGVELDHPYERRQHGLAPRPAMRTLEDPAGRHEERGIERVEMETIIGTDTGQVAVAPGALRRSWTEKGRRYYHYATDAPIRNSLVILSARYAVHRSRWNGVEVEVLHHPAHSRNVERFARAARTSLEVYSREFGPYPHRQLRLVEFPSTGGSRMTAHPGTVVWSEVFAYAHPEADPRRIDFPFAVVAHEVAHQWWGNQVVPARVEGAPLVSESLAWYSSMMVVEETFGREAFGRFMEGVRAAYLRPHQTPEVPLLRANDWLAVYRTGALAMNSMRAAIGEERVNAALRRFAGEYRSGRPPFPTSRDLYRELHAVTPAASRPLLKDLFEEVTFWDLRMQQVRAEPAAGAHRVTLDVEAYKVKAGSGGREQRVPMADTIEVAVFDADGAPLYRQPHRIVAGRQTITVTVPRAPASAAIDPDHKLLDRRREDNVKAF